MRVTGTSFVNDVGVRIQLNPRDGRAQSIHRRCGPHDDDAVSLWRELVDEMRPTVMIDVGANYGEVGLSYLLDNATLHLVEPNPLVLPMLRQTVEGFPNVTLHEFAASDKDGTTRLYTPRNRHGLTWSGVASIQPRRGSHVSVGTRRLDSVISLKRRDRVVFKIDTEGSEISVLRGMKSLLDVADGWVGMCETKQVDAVEREGFAVTPTQGKDYVLR